MTETYRDFYGCTASIRETKEGFILKVWDRRARKVLCNKYKTHRGAVRAMNNNTEATCERIDREVRK